MATRTVLSGPSCLRTHLKASLPSLRGSTCVIISSNLPEDQRDAPHPPPPLRRVRQSVSDSVQRATFTASMELNLRTVGCSVTGAYPTWDDVGTGAEMATRLGATSVLGVGAGAAIDCAKAVASVLSAAGGGGSEGVRLILAPSTLAGTMAAMSSTPMILSTAEEALLPPHLAAQPSAGIGRGPADFPNVGATVCLDADGMAFVTGGGGSAKGGGGTDHSVATPVHAALASLAVCAETSLLLASAGRTSLPPEDLEAAHVLVEGARSSAMAALDLCRDGASDPVGDLAARHHAAAALAHAGQLLLHGDGPGGRRSVGVALCSSVLPRYFPHGHALAFLAALLPGLCEAADLGTIPGGSAPTVRIGEEELGPGGLAAWAGAAAGGLPCGAAPRLAALAEGAPAVEEMMRSVAANGALVGSEEVGGGAFLEAVLHRSLNL